MKLPQLLVPWLLLVALGAGACNKSNPVTPTTCTFTAGPATTSTFGPEGGTGSAPVGAGSGCNWTAASNASFITISQGASGTGNGIVQFTIAANSATTDRTGTLTIAGSTITITQRASPVPPTPVTLSAPIGKSPSGGQTIDPGRPTLVVTNANATGNAGTITYHFEVSDLPSFPDDPVRTFTADGIAQGNGTTSWTVNHDLSPAVLWYWRARATNGTVTSDYSNVETFRTSSPCSFGISPTSVPVGAGGATSTIAVATTSGCGWTATSNASFITVTSGSSGTDSGQVTISVAANAGPARSGTITIAGQTVTVTQSGTGLFVGFQMIDAGIGPEPRTQCQIRSPNAQPSTCVLQSTSFTFGSATIIGYTWTVDYVYPASRHLVQTGLNPTFSFSETCGGTGSSDSGTEMEVKVTLNVIDSDGNNVTVMSNSGNQPRLTLLLFTCGM